MAELLGLGTTDQPYMRMIDPLLSSPLKGALKSERIRPELKDPKNWPAEMRELWGDDEGASGGRRARERQIPQFRKLRAALDDFQPDFILVWAKDGGESLKQFARPPFWIQAHTETHTKLYTSLGRKENLFGEDADRLITIPGHPDGAKYLVRGLIEHGFDPTFSLEPMHEDGLAHTFKGVVFHLDWDKREFATPVVPVSVDPFGTRRRGQDGMSPLTSEDVLPISAERAFELGRATARVLRASPWRVALVAGTGWSHANNTSWERSWIHPDMESDRRRHDEWASNKFDRWGSFTYAELEEFGQWEMLCWIALAGAMSEIGAKVQHSDFQEGWIFNSNWVNTIFSVA
ncbi:MAG TPA: hypothetical protein VGK54_02960 [Chloroflexota bacterium]|jgi:hypothetical protein